MVSLWRESPYIITNGVWTFQYHQKPVFRTIVEHNCRMKCQRPSSQCFRSLFVYWYFVVSLIFAFKRTKETDRKWKIYFIFIQLSLVLYKSRECMSRYMRLQLLSLVLLYFQLFQYFAFWGIEAKWKAMCVCVYGEHKPHILST